MVPFSCALSVNYDPDQKFQRNSQKIHTYVRGLVFILLDIFNPRNLGFCVLKMTKPTPPPLPPRHFDNGGKSKGSGEKGTVQFEGCVVCARASEKRNKILLQGFSFV